MQELVDIRNLTLACMFLNMFSIAACVGYMLWINQSIIDVMMTNWNNDDGETDNVIDYTVIRDGRIARGLNTNNDPPFYDYYLSTPITDDVVVLDIIKHARIIRVKFYDECCISVFVNPIWLHDAETLVIIDSLVNDAWVKLTEIKYKKSVDILVNTVDQPKINQSVFNDPDYGPVMKGKSHQNGIRSTILDDPEIDQISDKTSAEVDRPKVEI